MKNKIVDSHCHLDFEHFDDDLDQVLNNAKLRDVEYFLSISVDLKKFTKIHNIAKKYPFVWCTTGVHPNNVPEKLKINEIERLKKDLSNNLKSPKVVGVGETGLDYYRTQYNKKNQLSFFETHIAVSGESKSPLIIHTRDAEDDTKFCLNKFIKSYGSKGLLHCFSSSKDLARCALNNDLYISFSGIVTFKNSNELKEIVKYVPLDKILVETDSPYLSPVPYRGKRNEPSFVIHTLKTIAGIKKLSTCEMAKITTTNFFRLFKNIDHES